MFNLETTIMEYLVYCTDQKNLNEKTIKAYRIDLQQFTLFTQGTEEPATRGILSDYIAVLHNTYKPKSAKRKIASLKAFFTYLEYEEILLENPFSRMKIKYHEPFLLPRTISLQSLQNIFIAAYTAKDTAGTFYQKKCCIRDIAVLELLFAAGLRVSELCSLRQDNVELEQGTIRIYGKGSKERIIQITNENVLQALYQYKKVFANVIKNSSFFFVNRVGTRLSEQSVRFMIRRYATSAHVTEHITPHMFRHTFATMLLEEDVDIRYIQRILGHSSIVTTQIYTHVTSTKQREILTMKHPRNRMNVTLKNI